jgi:hypothetical protein
MKFVFDEHDEPKGSESKPNQEQSKPNKWVETTDCLEAIVVFKGWKNFLFILAMLCLLFTQTSFWLVNSGIVKSEEKNVQQPQTDLGGRQEPAQSVQNASKAEADSNKPILLTGKDTKPLPVSLLGQIKLIQLSHVLQAVNFLLFISSTLYFLVILFSLLISLVGRLGGINHISRAFFMALLFLILVCPWQKLFPDVAIGAIYTPKELIDACSVPREGIPLQVVHYLRFSFFWLVVTLMLIASQMRSRRWSKNILRRLEVLI